VREIAVRLALFEARLRLLDRRLGLLHRSLRLVNLLIQFRRVDFRHNLARVHVIADIHEAAFEVPVGASQNWRFGEGLHRPGQRHLGLDRAARQAYHGHTRELFLLRVCFGAENGLAPLQRQIAGQKRHNEQDHEYSQQRGHGRAGRTPTIRGRAAGWIVVARKLTLQLLQLASQLFLGCMDVVVSHLVSHGELPSPAPVLWSNSMGSRIPPYRASSATSSSPRSCFASSSCRRSS